MQETYVQNVQQSALNDSCFYMETAMHFITNVAVDDLYDGNYDEKGI
jgi:hypothetical protein